MKVVFLGVIVLIPFLTCYSVKKRNTRTLCQLLLLALTLACDSYFYYSTQINRVRESGRLWPWGRAGITEDDFFWGGRMEWSAEDYFFIDHLGGHHYLYILSSGLAFYSYIYFFTKVYDHYRAKKLASLA